MPDFFEAWTVDNWLNLILTVVTFITPISLAIISTRRPVSDANRAVDALSGDPRADVVRAGDDSRFLLPFLVVLFLLGSLMIGTALYGAGLTLIRPTLVPLPRILKAFALASGALCMIPIFLYVLGRVWSFRLSYFKVSILEAYRWLIVSLLVGIGAVAILASLGATGLIGANNLSSGEKWYLFVLSVAISVLVLVNVITWWETKGLGSDSSIDITLCLSLLVLPLTFSSGQFLSSTTPSRYCEYDAQAELSPGTWALMIPPAALSQNPFVVGKDTVVISEPEVVQVLDTINSSSVEVGSEEFSGFVDARNLHILESASENSSIEPCRKIVNYALKYLGYPYVWETHGPASFDSSGFTYWVILNTMENNIGAGIWTQVAAGSSVSKNDLQMGDLVFFQNTFTSGLSHVGIYIGNGNFVHAKNEAEGVTVSALDSPYWSERWYGAVRLAS